MKHILVVDDNTTNLKLVKSVLEPEYKVTILTSGAQMLKFIDMHTPDLILLDIEMPELDGFEVLDQLKNDNKMDVAPIMFLTALNDAETETRALSAGVVDFIAKPFVAETMRSRIRVHLEINEYRRNLEGLVNEKMYQIEALQDALAFSIAGLVGCRDGYTGVHVKRTCAYVDVLCHEMLRQGLFPDELNQTSVRQMVRAAALHDIGKVGIKDEILCKPGSFTGEEFEFMKQHARLGADTLEETITQTRAESFLSLARDMACYHHEKWDGTGYLCSLSGQDIPLGARILAVADVYDALTSKRPYKEAFTHDTAVTIIAQGKGSSFDPVVVEAFLACAPQFEALLNNAE